MILTCPNCATRYQTDATIAAPGRNVRCAKCGQVWFQSPPELEPEPMPEMEMELAPAEASAHAEETAYATHAHSTHAEYSDAGAVEEQPYRVTEYERPRTVAPPKQGPSFLRVAGWAVLIVIVLAVLYAIISYRESIATAWPQTSSIYAAIGMPVNVLGLALNDVTPAQTFDAGQAQLEVSGRVVNVADRDIRVPRLRVALIDADAREIYRWTFDSGLRILGPGQGGGFTTRLNAPPREAQHVSVRFAEAGEQ